MGTYQTSFTVPNLNREEKRIPISSVVLGGQRVPLGDALYSVEQKISAEAVNPLVFEGQKLTLASFRAIQGGGEAKKERCFQCHNDEKRLSRFTDIDFMHKKHVTDKKVEGLDSITVAEGEKLCWG
jgi:hypothetical protein